MIMDTTNLGNIIKNDKARQIIYATWFILGIVIGAVQVAFTDPDPQWLETSFNVWSYLGIPIAALASANSKSQPDLITVKQADSVQGENVTVAPDTFVEHNDDTI